MSKPKRLASTSSRLRANSSQATQAQPSRTTRAVCVYRIASLIPCSEHERDQQLCGNAALAWHHHYSTRRCRKSPDQCRVDFFAAGRRDYRSRPATRNDANCNHVGRFRGTRDVADTRRDDGFAPLLHAPLLSLRTGFPPVSAGDGKLVLPRLGNTMGCRPSAASPLQRSTA